MRDFIDFKTLKRPTKPNTCLVAPPDYCDTAKPDFHNPPFQAPIAELFARVKDLVHQERSWARLVTDETNWRLSFVATTSFLRFKDDVDIQLIAISDTETDIAIYSRSRVGHSDFGANRKRVKSLLAEMTRN